MVHLPKVQTAGRYTDAKQQLPKAIAARCEEAC